MARLVHFLSLPVLMGILVAAILLCVPLVVHSPYVLDMILSVFLYAFLNNAWNILGGYCGQVSVGHAAYFAIGAYTSTILFIHYNISPWIGMVAGALVAGVLAVLMGYPSLKLKGPYFVFATLGFAEIVRIILTNWEKAGAAMGLLIPLRPSSLIHLQFSSKVPYYYLMLFICAGGFALTYLIENSKWGSYFIAIREDEDAAEALGINTAYYKTAAFVISAMLMAIGGTFYAQYVLYIHPDTTSTLMMSCNLLVMAVIGGAGTVLGPTVGALLFVPLGEYTRALLGGRVQGLHLMIYGAALMIVVTIAPEGVVGLLSRAKSDYRTRRKKGEQETGT